MALKTCPACQKQLGPRTKKCECGHAFVTETAAVPASGQSMTLDPLEQRVADSVGAVKDILKRAETRPATAVPVSRAVEQTDASKPDVPKLGNYAGIRHHSGIGRIAIPAGEPPLKPQGYKKGWPDGPASPEVVQKWAVDIYNWGEGRYTTEAVQYWARYFWEINSPEFSKIRELIAQALGSKRSLHESVDDDHLDEQLV